MQKNKDKYKAALLKELQRHKTKIESLSTTKIAEKNEKEVTNATLKYLLNDNDKLDAATITTLREIAAQCPDSGGGAVYNARGLLSKFEIPPSYNDDKLCERPLTHVNPSKILNAEVESRGNSANVQPILYPNPVKNKEFSINMHSFTEKPNHIVLFNSLGEKILEQRIIDEEAVINTISLPEVGYGLYLLNIKKDNHIIHSEKLLIQY